MSFLFSPHRPQGATNARGATPSGFEDEFAAFEASLKRVGSYEDVVVEVACLDKEGVESDVAASGGGILGVGGVETGMYLCNVWLFQASVAALNGSIVTVLSINSSKNVFLFQRSLKVCKEGAFSSLRSSSNSSISLRKNLVLRMSKVVTEEDEEDEDIEGLVVMEWRCDANSAAAEFEDDAVAACGSKASLNSVKAGKSNLN